MAPSPSLSSCSDSTFGTFKWLHKKSGPLKQMMSPIRFQGGNDAGKGIDYFLGTGLPNTIGYPIAYSFTGLGSNQGGWFSKMGVASTKESNRVLGANYFLPMIDKDQKPMICSSDSEDGCGGAQMHTYIQQYPSKPMGLLPAVVDGITHMNPGMFLDAMYDALTESKPKCRRVTLPVGSGLNQCTSTTFISPSIPLGYQPGVTEPCGASAIYDKCKSKCATVNLYDRNNCNRECEQIWWEESQCVPVTKSTDTITANQCMRGPNKADEKQYEIPYGGKPAKDGGSAKSMSFKNRQERLKNSVTQIQNAGVAPAPESFVGANNGTIYTPSHTRPKRHTFVWWVVMFVVVLVLGGLALWRLCVV